MKIKTQEIVLFLVTAIVILGFGLAPASYYGDIEEIRIPLIICAAFVGVFFWIGTHYNQPKKK